MPRSHLLLILTLAACASGPAPADAAADRAAVAARWTAYTAAIPSVDPDTLASFFAPDARLFEPGIAVRGRDSIRALFTAFRGATIDRFAAAVDTIEIHGDHAALWGTFEEAYTVPGQPQVSEAGRFVVELGRGPEGGWYFERFMTQPVPPASQH